MRKYVVTGLLAIVVGITGTACKDSKQSPETPQLKPVCTTSPVMVGRDEPTPCNLERPQVLDITGMSEGECADAGGRLDIDNICRDVDY